MVLVDPSGLAFPAALLDLFHLQVLVDQPALVVLGGLEVREVLARTRA